MCPSDFLWSVDAGQAKALAPVDTLGYLRSLGFGDNSLKEARLAVEAARETPFVFETDGTNYCDFCLARLTGVEYDVLADGRDRCVRCSRSVVRSRADFAEIVSTVRDNLELAFDVRVTLPAQLRMVNAKEIGRRSGETFVATPGADPRVLGFAKKDREGYSLFIENGAPKLAATATLAHELTHIWQYRTWDERQIVAHYGAERRLPLYEGMASWVEIQYLYFIKEFDYARRQEEYTRARADAYGQGFRDFAEGYPIDRDGDTDGDSPFRRTPPL